MKIFSLLLSAGTLGITLYFLITQFPEINSFDSAIYLGLMLILLLISVVGIIVNVPAISRIHHRFRLSGTE